VTPPIRSLNGCDRTAKSDSRLREIGKNAEAARVRNTFRSRSSSSKQLQSLYLDGIEFSGFSWIVISLTPRHLSRCERRCSLDRFRDLLSHLGLKQRRFGFLLSCLKMNQKTDATLQP